MACALVLATIVAGGLVAGTEGEGKPSEPVLGAHTACGEQFPTCLDRFMPFDEGRLVDIQLTHRAFMYLAAIAVLAMTALALRQGARHPGVLGRLGAPGRADPLGALNVWLGEHAGLIAAHLTLGTLLWGTVVTAATSMPPASAPAHTDLGRARGRQARRRPEHGERDHHQPTSRRLAGRAAGARGAAAARPAAVAPGASPRRPRRATTSR